jgi:flagellar biosynthetic protein FliR
MNDWNQYLIAVVLVLIRLSGLMVFAPIFSSLAIPAQVKIGFTLALTALLAPIAELHSAHLVLSFAAVAGELGVSLIFGLSLKLLTEMIGMAGVLLGFQMSFSLVNVLDPNSPVETPVLSQMLSLLVLLVLFAAGLDRTLLSALLRTFVVVPVGMAVVPGRTGVMLLSMMGGVFLSAVQLAATVIAATVMVDVTSALMGRLAPQLPVLFVGLPVKSLVGYGVLIGALGIWPRYIEARFDALLNAAMQMVLASGAQH